MKNKNEKTDEGVELGLYLSELEFRLEPGSRSSVKLILAGSCTMKQFSAIEAAMNNKQKILCKAGSFSSDGLHTIKLGMK